MLPIIEWLTWLATIFSALKDAGELKQTTNKQGLLKLFVRSYVCLGRFVVDLRLLKESLSYERLVSFDEIEPLVRELAETIREFDWLMTGNYSYLTALEIMDIKLRGPIHAYIGTEGMYGDKLFWYFHPDPKLNWDVNKVELLKRTEDMIVETNAVRASLQEIIKQHFTLEDVLTVV